MLVTLAMFTGMSFGRHFASVMLEKDAPEDGGGTGIVGVADETPTDASPNDDHDVPLDIRQRMREWLVYFFNPPEKTLAS